MSSHEASVPSNERTRPTIPFATNRPTRPLDRSVENPSRHGRCLSGHSQPNNPTWHPALGLVPAMSSVIFGGIILLTVLAIEAWLVPDWIVWTVAVALAGLAVSALAQFMLGHRGWCWLRRTLRWWLGPIGTLMDPFEMG